MHSLPFRYDPYLLQNPGSIVKLEVEVQVIKTIIGILAVMLRVFGTDLETDIQVLRSENVSDHGPSTLTAVGVQQVNSDDIIGDVHKILRNVFKIPPPLPNSPTVRRMSARLASASSEINSTDNWSESTGVGSVEDLVKDSLVASKNKNKNKNGEVSSTTPTTTPPTPSPYRNSLAQAYAVGTFSTLPESTDMNTKTEIEIDTLMSKGESASKFNDNDRGDKNSRIKSRDGSSVIYPLNNLVVEQSSDEDEVDINQLGLGLPVNVREPLRYRIRKKRAIYKLIRELSRSYKSLCLQGSLEDNLIAPLSTKPGSRVATVRALMEDVEVGSNNFITWSIFI